MFRWSDVDFAASFLRLYVRLFEIAETEMFRHCGLAYARMFDEYDISSAQSSTQRVLLAGRLDDRLRIAAYVGKVGTNP